MVLYCTTRRGEGRGDISLGLDYLTSEAILPVGVELSTVNFDFSSRLHKDRLAGYSGTMQLDG